MCTPGARSLRGPVRILLPQGVADSIVCKGNAVLEMTPQDNGLFKIDGVFFRQPEILEVPGLRQRRSMDFCMLYQ